MSDIRGIVLESGKGWAVVLLKNGEYRRVITFRSLMPGEIYQGKNHANYGKYTAAAAAFLIILMGVVDFFNVVAYAEVSSGVEMGVNRWNRVVSVSAINSEGEMLLEEISIKGQNLDAALEIILGKALAEDNSSDLAEITVIVKKANDKPLPPGIAKKVDDVIAQDGISDYDLIQIQVNDKEQTVYGLTIRDKVRQQMSKEDEDTGEPQELNAGPKDNGTDANANDNEKNENYQNGRNKDEQLNEETTVGSEEPDDNEVEEVNPNKSDKSNKSNKSNKSEAVQKIPDQALDKIPDEVLDEITKE